jgi:hypothetical protein
MDNIFTYLGQNVDGLTHEEAIKALKNCIHELEQERRYKQSLPDRELSRAAFRMGASVEFVKDTYMNTNAKHPTQNLVPYGGHLPDCGWHLDQYDFECTCGKSTKTPSPPEES